MNETSTDQRPLIKQPVEQHVLEQAVARSIAAQARITSLRADLRQARIEFEAANDVLRKLSSRVEENKL